MPPSRSLHLPVPLTLCAALLTVSAGCSFAFVDGPPTNHRKLPFFSCTTSNTLPIVDLVIGGALAASSVGVIDGSGSGSNTTATVAVAVGEAALFAASAIYGFNKTSACRDASAELLGRLPPTPGYAPAYAPGYPPPQPAYDPWLSPPPGAFAAPPQPPAAPPPGAAPAPTPAPKPPADDRETPHASPTKP